MEKIQPMSLRFQSPGADCVIQSSFVSGKLKVEKAYTWPMHKCTAKAAGGTWNRLNPGGATVLSRAKKPVLIKAYPYVFVYLRGDKLQYAPTHCNCHYCCSLHGAAAAANYVTFILWIVRGAQVEKCKTVTLSNACIAGNP
jgi:hypothetical protein